MEIVVFVSSIAVDVFCFVNCGVGCWVSWVALLLDKGKVKVYM